MHCLTVPVLMRMVTRLVSFTVLPGRKMCRCVMFERLNSAMMTLPVVMRPYKAGHQVELFYKGGKCVDESSPPLEIVWADPS